MAHLTTKQVMAGFKVSDMTIYTWRQGSSTRDKLPCVAEGRKVSFKDSDMKAWAKKYGLTFSLEAALKVPGTAAAPGPKPKAAPAKKVASVKAKVAAVVEKAKRETPAGKKQAKAVSDAMQATKKAVAKKPKAATAAAAP